MRKRNVDTAEENSMRGVEENSMRGVEENSMRGVEDYKYHFTIYHDHTGGGMRGEYTLFTVTSGVKLTNFLFVSDSSGAKFEAGSEAINNTFNGQAYIESGASVSGKTVNRGTIYGNGGSINGSIENSGSIFLSSGSLNASVDNESSAILSGGKEGPVFVYGSVRGGSLQGLMDFKAGAILGVADLRTVTNIASGAVINLTKGVKLRGAITNNGTLGLYSSNVENVSITNSGVIYGGTSGDSVDIRSLITIDGGSLSGLFDFNTAVTLNSISITTDARLNFHTYPIFGGEIANAGTLDFSALSSVAANVSGTGTIQGAASGKLVWYGRLSGGHITGNITFASGSTFTNGTINAGALADFSRGSSLGGTITNAGTLDVSALGSVSANVSGTGTIQGGTSSAVNWYGRLSGGHITGNITFAQGATLSGTITNDGTLDVSALGSVSANVSGTGTIQGGTSSAVNWYGRLSGGHITGNITFASGSTFTNGTINAGALADFSRGSS
ncbi:hypothetical protein HW509_14425, partial [Asaia spathodeae]